MALQRAGITRDTMPPAPSIQIDKDPATGEPNGVLTEFTYKPLVETTLMASIPRFTLDDRIEGLGALDARSTTPSARPACSRATASPARCWPPTRSCARGARSPVRAVLMFSPAWPSTDISRRSATCSPTGGAGSPAAAWAMPTCACAGLYTESEYTIENRLRATCGPYTGWAGFNFDCALPEDVPWSR